MSLFALNNTGNFGLSLAQVAEILMGKDVSATSIRYCDSRMPAVVVDENLVAHWPLYLGLQDARGRAQGVIDSLLRGCRLFRAWPLNGAIVWLNTDVVDKLANADFTENYVATPLHNSLGPPFEMWVGLLYFLPRTGVNQEVLGYTSRVHSARDALHFLREAVQQAKQEVKPPVVAAA